MYEVYVEVFRITERKDGAVYKTKSEGHKWVSMDQDHKRPSGDGKDLIYSAPSTCVTKDRLSQGKGNIRKVTS